MRCGYVAVVGLPNAGKSTLLNGLLGEKVSIVSNKPQTTQTCVLGVHTNESRDTQVIFVDTPGIYAHSCVGDGGVDRELVKFAREGVSASDCLLFVVDAKRASQSFIFAEEFLPSDMPSFLVLNKVDLVSKATLLDLVTEFLKIRPFQEVFMTSASKKRGIDVILSSLEKKMPEGELMYEPGQKRLTDFSEFAAELIREKVFQRLYREIPYYVSVSLENMEELSDGSMKLNYAISVPRETHKGIVIGHQGSVLKMIGTEARKELEQIYNMGIHLFLYVKVVRSSGY